MTFERQRKLKQHLFLNEAWLSLPPLPRLLFLSLGWYADDHGREKVNVALMKGQMFALNTEITASAIEDALLQLDAAELLYLYAKGRDTYFQIVPWAAWWSVDRPTASVIPALSNSRTAREALANGSRTFVAGEREREGGSAREGEDHREPLANARPDPFCSAHPDGTDEDCRACGRRRLRLEKWHSERAERAASTEED